MSHSFARGRLIADSLDKAMLTIVLAKGDQFGFEDKTCQVLGLDEKKGKAYLKIIERDFIIVKLRSSQFRNEIHDSMFYHEGAKEFVNDALELEKSFIFISNPQYPSVYGPTYLSEKEQVKDLIWVKFGP